MNPGDDILVSGRHGVVLSRVYGFVFVVMDSGRIVLTRLEGCVV